jgi:hypothetical protein
MLIKSKKIGIPSLTPNKGVETDSFSQLATGALGGGGGGGTVVHKEFSVTYAAPVQNNSDYHYEMFEHSLGSEFILAQVYEWDDANSKRGDLVQCDILYSNHVDIPTGKTNQTQDNLCVRIYKPAVTGTQWFTVIVR